MPTTFANTINGNEILAKRAECDYAGADIQTTYATKTEVTTGLASKEDAISDLAAIRSGAQAGATAVQPGDLATVATTGSYDDLTDKPDLSVYATDSELSSGLATKQDTISDLATIRSGAALGATSVQPSDLATVATTGDYDDLTDKPDLSIYAESSNLATVATTGDYNDLSNKPSIPTVPTAGNMLSVTSNTLNVTTTAGITDIQQVTALPAQPVATVLYLIPEA